jgi:hypothetical protein
VHPPSGSHSGNKVIRSIEQYQSLFDYAIRKVDNGGFERLLDSDYIYFDPDRDVKLGKTMIGSRRPRPWVFFNRLIVKTQLITRCRIFYLWICQLVYVIY